MKCPKYEQWISDALDRSLSEKRRKILEDHLAQCPDCRAYNDRLSRIQAEALRPEKIKPASPQYWEEFSASLEKKLQALEPERETTRLSRLGWKWAWAGAPLLLALALGLVFLRNQGRPLEDDVFSFEACLNLLGQEIGDDAKLEENFTRLILGCLKEALGSAVLEERWVVSDDPFFWESLSDDELEFLEQEITKEMKS
jgi:predicted anti-sigma-YlaC factor YlaD